MIGVAISFLALTRTVPDMVQSIINGIAVGGSGGLWGAAAQTFSAGAIAAGAVGRGAGGAFTAGSAVREASKLASAQGQGGVMGTARALSSAMGSSAADKIRGVPSAQFGSTGGRAIEGMRNQRSAIQGQPISSPAAGTAAAQYISPVGSQPDEDGKK
jgi:type IV secretion system protein TrbL